MTGERFTLRTTDDDGTVHELGTNAAAEGGLTSGTADGAYAPAAPVRRDAMASFVARLLDLWVEQRQTSPPGNRA